MSWSSSNTAVATVSDLGVVTGVAPGTTTIALTIGSVTSDPVVVTVITCGAPFTAPSGKVYNTAAYGNDNLTGLCWTTTNLQEAGYSATCYMNDCETYPTRGYYYIRGAGSDIACAALNSGGTGWRIPTTSEWVALQTAFPSLSPGVGTSGDTASLQIAWNGAAIMAGDYDGRDLIMWRHWGAHGGWYANSTSNSFNVFTVGLNETVMRNWNRTGYEYTVRCVRDL
jgi:uncharacterized protein (TIGR02145 family)